ncbi:apses-domain-containing protein [Rhizopus microsporus var. microsporus]|uniref:Apses-domain-containing protein n=1 Tax=Rhizopus microsporus var. microsporus TaxID=86635 RepID=A0A1X0QXZ5_RHIZD|nr:apses-domain-containing protein [Rhizopus microsporus var. microsporus]
MANSQQVFQATYSGVPVYEMLCRGVAVMRRKSDSYLNATQILKVAGFDKPHRTRILEREVQTGQHEKVQGGYGKYQGTWVPLERGKELAQLYEVDNLLDPILNFVKGDKSPPIAPKHTTAASARAKKAAREPRPVRKRVRREMVEEDISDIDDMSHHGIHILPAPVEAAASPGRRTRHVKERRHNNKPAVVKEERPEVKEPAVEPAIIVDDPVIDDYDSREKTYAQKLLQFFMSGRQGIPSLLAYPSRDLDLNLIIDDEGHTSLHWASAMARIDIVKTLIDHGAEIDRVNYQGQTALMRSVLFTNNFDEKTFDTLLTFLRPTVFHIDKKDQTVFHHIATTAGSKGKVHASRYYMECLINKLSSNRSELISILNVQDAYGDTALTIAARIGNKRLIKLLIDAGASTEIANEDGMTSRDYINEMERRSAGEFSSLLPFQTNNDILLADANSHEALRQKVNTMFKQVISSLNNNDVVPPISEVFDSFAESYERDLISKENSVQKKRIELELYTKRLAETKRVLESIVFNAEDTIAYEETGKRGLLLESRLKK